VAERAKARSQVRVRALLGMSQEPFGGAATEVSFGRYGLGQSRSLASFEAALGVRFGPGLETSQETNQGGGGLGPEVVAAEAKWGGLDAARFNENSRAAEQQAALLALAAAMGRGF